MVWPVWRTWTTDKAEELVFSARFACPVCGYSISELEPRMFSFNNPAGACQECDGLGVKQFFDPALVVQDEELTLAEGAIRGWDRRNVYYFHMLSSLAEHYKFDVEAPFSGLKQKHRDAILFGSGSERIDFSYVNDRGDVIQRRHRFEGVIPNMERRYHETDSNMVRDNLQKFLRVRDCQSCGGTRLREESRHVFIDWREPAGYLFGLCGRDAELFQRSEAQRPTWRDRGQDSQGNPRPIAVPGGCRSQLPDPRSQRRNALRWRSTADPTGQPDRRRDWSA